MFIKTNIADINLAFQCKTYTSTSDNTTFIGKDETYFIFNK